MEAWRYGPVIPVVYHGVKRYGRAPVRSLIRGPLFPRAAVDFTPREDDLVDQVFDVYGGFSGIELSMMTHARDTPWHQVWYREGRNAVIPDSLIQEHFTAKLEAA